jgi:hypothetical protein
VYVMIILGLPNYPSHKNPIKSRVERGPGTPNDYPAAFVPPDPEFGIRAIRRFPEGIGS